jgi:hypothetical protein
LLTAAPAAWASMWVSDTTGVTSSLMWLPAGPKYFSAPTLGCGVLHVSSLGALCSHVSSLGALCSWYISVEATHSWLLYMQIKSYNYAKPGFNSTTAAFT